MLLPVAFFLPGAQLPTWLGWFGHRTVWVSFSIGLAALGVVSMLLVPRCVAKMPADYFIRPPAPGRRGTIAWLARIAKNLLGLVLLLLGFAMLVLPGQGVLTVLAALAVMDFPGKRRMVRAIACRRPVSRILHSLRQRAGRPPFTFASVDASSRAPPRPPV